MTTPRIILASSSPQRKRLLAEMGHDFEVISPIGDEPDSKFFTDAAAYVTHTAWLKARDVASQVESGLVIAADTAVALAGQMFGKPTDLDDARRILQQLSGSTHQCWTGVCLWPRPGNDWIGAVDVTDLRMRELTRDELNGYLAGDRWVGKAGAYAIQDPDPYVSIIRGSHSNVVGLPTELLERLLRRVSL